MKAIAYCNPFVPPEWIAAHGLRPLWLRLRPARGEFGAMSNRGVCPVASALMETLACGSAAAAVVLTTTCDQIRHAAAVLEQFGKPPVFLMHVPRTWQSAAARSFFRDEILRLGRFLESLCGKAPAPDLLRETMVRYEQVRAELRRRREEMSAREFFEASARVRGDLQDSLLVPTLHVGTDESRRSGSALSPLTDTERRKAAGSHAERGNQEVNAERGNQEVNAERGNQEVNAERGNQKIPLALVGGPMLGGDEELLDFAEHAGACFVLDATESGERTLPAPLEASRLRADPLDELVSAYFDAIADVFRRPNDRLYCWLKTETARRGVRGIVVRRHLWCDLWHAELPRLRQECSLPLLEWESGGDGRGATAAASRIEAFLEMLR